MRLPIGGGLYSGQLLFEEIRLFVPEQKRTKIRFMAGKADLEFQRSKTKTNKTGSSQVGAISKAQKYSKNNYWKHLEKLLIESEIFRKKSRIVPKKTQRWDPLVSPAVLLEA